ncbi:hypothetical protein [Cognatilysobacter lacus]|uniref:Uncharacterized protein n=1 Tax=Cognatilysobacter lacus TaxID=1643323 RepID=A0A5D8Z1R6_9GAMM|nr:hypothetical protein [Lysobacter lacus]TZF88945.1 hypothetical protein FW784_09300 [Lysobacter lacus]
MKMMLFALVLAAGAAQAQAVDSTASASAEAPTASTSQAEPAPGAEPKVADTGQRKLCKLERELGSNRAKRVCRTREEIDASTEAARASISAAQRGN